MGLAGLPGQVLNKLRNFILELALNFLFIFVPSKVHSTVQNTPLRIKQIETRVQETVGNDPPARASAGRAVCWRDSGARGSCALRSRLVDSKGERGHGRGC